MLRQQPVFRVVSCKLVHTVKTDAGAVQNSDALNALIKSDVERTQNTQNRIRGLTHCMQHVHDMFSRKKIENSCAHFGGLRQDEITSDGGRCSDFQNANEFLSASKLPTPVITIVTWEQIVRDYPGAYKTLKSGLPQHSAGPTNVQFPQLFRTNNSRVWLLRYKFTYLVCKANLFEL